MDQCTHEVRAEYWRNIIKACGQRPAGQSAKKWMDENGICEQSYYHWQRKFRQQAYDQMKEKEMLPSVTEKAEASFAEIPYSPAVGPERLLLVDQIYRTRENRAFCKQHGSRMSGPKLRWPSAKQPSGKEKKQEYQDNTDRIGIKREFSLEKYSYGLGLITIKLEATQLSSFALFVFVSHLFKMQRRILCAFMEKWGLFHSLTECFVILLA